MYEFASTLKALWQIGRTPVSEQRNQQALWVHTLGLVGLIALAGALLLIEVKWRLVLLIESIIVVAFAMMWWAYFVGSALMQCTPANLQLVPRLPSLVKLAAAALWLAGSLALALMMALQFGNLIPWWIVMALAMLVLAWLARLPRLVILPFALSLGFFAPQIRHIDFNAPDAGILAVAALATLAFAVFTLALLFDLEGERGYRVQKRFHLERAARPSSPFHQLAPRLLNTLTSGRPLYLWMLKRALATESQPTKLIVFVFGPKAHWSNLLWGLFLTFWLTFPLWLSLPIWDSEKAHGFVNALMIPLGAILFVQTTIRPMLFLPTRREQGLLLLSPGAPQGRELNREVAQILLRLFPVHWLGLLCVFAIPMGLLGRHGEAFILHALATALVGGLFGLGAELKSYARMKSRPEFDIGEALKRTFLALISIAPLALTGALFGSKAYLELLAVYLICALVFVAARWRRMIDGPAVVPAGRLAND